MNRRLFAIALLISTIPIFALAGPAGIALNQGDFIAAERTTVDGETLVKVKLSKSGKSKFKKLNAGPTNQKVHAEIAGVNSDMVVRSPIRGDALQMGPYSREDATKVIEAINHK